MLPRRLDGARALAAPRGSTLVAIGNFDGVHRGHRAVLERAAGRARSAGLRPVVLTFHPHPAEVLGRGKQPALTGIDRKVELLCRTSPELVVVVERFTEELSRMSPRDFAEELLVDALGARVVIVGQNFRFGRDRAGDLSVLESLGQELGFSAGAEPLQGDAEGTYSSSRAREALRAGDLAEFHRVVGRPHALSGEVVRGDGRGKTLGFPTANLADVEEALPPDGVYACAVDHLDASGQAVKLSTGVLNVGQRPTVSAGFSVEVHLFGTHGDLYGTRLRVHLVEFLRPERRFAGLDALVAQIREDAGRARTTTANLVPDGEAQPGWY